MRPEFCQNDYHNIFFFGFQMPRVRMGQMTTHQIIENDQ